MADSDRNAIVQHLSHRRQIVAEGLAEDLAAASGGVLDAAEARSRLADLAERVIDLVCADVFDPDEAEAAGAFLSALPGVPHESLAQTLESVPFRLLQGLEIEAVAALEPRLAALMSRLAAGFAARTWQIMQRQQEQEHSAMLDAVRQRTRAAEEANQALMAEIAERVKAEEALRDSQETNRALLNAPSAVVLLMDADGILLDVNETMVRRFHRPANELIGSCVWDLFDPRVVERRKALCAAVLLSGRPMRFEDQRDGIWNDNTIYPVLDSQGRVTRVAVLSHDITHLKDLQQQLHDSESAAWVLLNAPSDAIYLVDAEGRLLAVNGAGALFLGSTVQQLIGSNVFDLLSPGVAERRRHAAQQVIDSGEPLRSESQVGSRWFDASIYPIHDENGKIARLAVFSREITARKHVEEALRRSLEETARGHRLLAGLGQAAQAVQQALTTEDVYRTVGQELSELGYHVLFLEVTEDRRHLAMRYVSAQPRLVRASERVAGQSAAGYCFPLTEGGFFDDLVRTPRVAFIDDRSRAVEIVAEAMPGPQRPRARRLASLLKLERMVVAPLGKEGQAEGLLVVTGRDLRQSDVEAVSVFAGQTAIALQNARLFRATQAWSDTLEQRVAERTADLAAAEERYGALFNCTNDALIVVDMEGRYIDANPAACRMLGYSRAELLTLGVQEVAAAYQGLSPDEKALMLQKHSGEWRAPRAGLDVGMIDKSGKLIDVEISYAPVTYRGQEAVLSALRDITERRRMQEALRENERRLRSQYQKLPVPTYTWQREGDDLVLADFNEAADALSQGRLDGMRGIKATELFRDSAAVREAIERSLREQTTTRWEGPYRYTATDILRTLIGTCVFVPPDQVLVHTEDVTERERAAEEVRRSQEETARERNLLRALSGAAQSVARARSPQEVYDAIGLEIKRLGLRAVVLEVGLDHSYVRVHYMTHAADLQQVARRSLGLKPTEILAPLAPHGFFEPLISGGEVLYCDRTAELTARVYPQLDRAVLEGSLFRLGMQRAVFVPMHVNDQPLQVLAVFGPDLRETDRPAIAGFASQAAIALENARLLQELSISSENRRLLAQRLVAAQEDERLRMSRALHDEAGQNLTALRISLQLLREDMAEGAEDLRQRADDAAELAAQTLERLRRLAQDLRPPALDTVGLDQALAGCCVDFARHTKIHVTYQGVELPALSGPVGITLYRLLQEALTNSARHAHAHEIHVTLQREDDDIVLSVEDDGQGFDVATLLAQKGQNGGLGLLGVRERLETLGGQLEISARPGHGTRLVGWIPSRDLHARGGGSHD